MSEPTPGEWKIRRGYGLLMAEIGPDDRAVATVWVKKMGQVDDKTVPVEYPEGEANARLIVAAKDLLKALRKIEEETWSQEDTRLLIRSIARKAITKTMPHGGLCPGCTDPECLGSPHPELCKEAPHA